MPNLIRVVKVKAGRAKFRETLKQELARKGVRGRVLINCLARERDAVVWDCARLDAIALELRHLAFQIRTLKQAKLATEEA